MTTEQLTSTTADTANSAEKGLLIAMLVLVLLGVAGMLFMV